MFKSDQCRMSIRRRPEDLETSCGATTYPRENWLKLFHCFRLIKCASNPCILVKNSLLIEPMLRLILAFTAKVKNQKQALPI